MPRYYHEHSYHKQTRFIRRLKFFVAFLFVGLLGIAGYVGYDAVRANQKSSTASAPTEKITSVYEPKTEIFTTKYFQFEADKTWSPIAGETSDTTFTYRSSRRNLTEQDITIIINDTKPMMDYGRVLPVDVLEDQTIRPGNVSELCGKLLPATAPKITQSYTYERVSFLCNYDATDYIAIVGKRGTTVPLELKRPDGSTAKYSIIYRNSKATPDDTTIRQIMSSFQAR